MILKYYHKESATQKGKWLLLYCIDPPKKEHQQSVRTKSSSIYIITPTSNLPSQVEVTHGAIVCFKYLMHCLVYTGMIYEGPGMARDVKKGLSTKLKEDGFSNVADAVGVDSAIL